MCARVKNEHDVRELKIAVEFPDDISWPNIQPNWNLAPTHDMLIARRDENGRRIPELMHWGLVPRWSPEFKMKGATFNAKAETVATKPTFRDAWAKGRRCLLITSGWYEWREAPDNQPFCFQRANSPVTVMAGLWEEWKDAKTGERRRSCTMITTEPNEAIAALPHSRMPVVLDEKDWPMWLGEAPGDPDELMGLLKPYEGKLKLWPISRRVGKPENNDPTIADEVPIGSEPLPEKKTRAAKDKTPAKQGSLF